MFYYSFYGWYFQSFLVESSIFLPIWHWTSAAWFRASCSLLVSFSPIFLNSSKVIRADKFNIDNLIILEREKPLKVQFFFPEKRDNQGLSPFHPRKIIVIRECPLLSPETISLALEIRYLHSNLVEKYLLTEAFGGSRIWNFYLLIWGNGGSEIRRESWKMKWRWKDLNPGQCWPLK